MLLFENAKTYSQELGNKAFLNKNYEEAIECFSKAIEFD